MLRSDSIQHDIFSDGSGGLVIETRLTLTAKARIEMSTFLCARTLKERIVRDIKQGNTRKILHECYGELSDRLHELSCAIYRLPDPASSERDLELYAKDIRRKEQQRADIHKMMKEIMDLVEAKE